MIQRPYQQLLVWQQAHALCVQMYQETKSFPLDERRRLVDQICRSASSVPTNIAEGNAKRSFKEKRKYFEIALASLDETHYHCLLAKDLSYISEEQFVGFAEQIKSINILLTRLRESFKE
jgi:four helix bundle protein